MQMTSQSQGTIPGSRAFPRRSSGTGTEDGLGGREKRPFQEKGQL